MLKRSIFALVIVVTSIISADPFSSQWNWENQKVNGPVKEIIVVNKYGKVIESFNKKGQKVLKEDFDKDGKRMYKTRIKYNNDGYINEVWFSKKNSDKPMYIETATFKSKGSIDSIKSVRGGKTITSKAFTYDKNGLSSISLDSRSRIMTWKFLFSKNKNLQESSLMYDDKVKGLSKYKYDNKGNATNIESYRNGAIVGVSKVEYVYDSHNNWVKKTTISEYHRDGKIVKSRTSIKERTINYF